MDIANLGKLIKTLRKEKKMTQEDLASKLGVTISAISKWETGKNSPDITMLHRLSEVLEISLEELYTPEDTLGRRSSKGFSSEYTDIGMPESVTSPSESDSDTCTNTKVPKIKAVTKRHSYRGLLLALAILLILTTIGSTMYLLQSKNQKPSIRPYAFRNVEDEYYGFIYEMGCVYSGNLDDLTYDDPYLLQLSDSWVNDETIPAEITIMRVSLYASEEEALQWTIPQQVYYFVR